MNGNNTDTGYLAELALVRANGANSSLNPAIQKVITAITWIPTGGGDVETWAEVMDVVNNNDQKPVKIWIIGAGPFDIPPGTYDLHASEFSQRDGDQPLINCQDGVILRHLVGLNGCTLRGNNTSFGLLQQTIPAMTFAATLENLGTVALFNFTENNTNFAGVNFSGPSIFSGVSTAPIINMDDPGFNFLIVNSDHIFFIANPFPDGSVINNPSAFNALVMIHDGSLPDSFPYFLPTYTGQEYNNPQLRLGGSGPDQYVPQNLLLPPEIGTNYWHTEWNSNIFWDGFNFQQNAAPCTLATRPVTGTAGNLLPTGFTVFVTDSGANGQLLTWNQALLAGVGAWVDGTSTIVA